MPTKSGVTTNVRLPGLLHKKLLLKAERERRSLNGQIVFALEQSVADITDAEAAQYKKNEQTS